MVKGTTIKCTNSLSPPNDERTVRVNIGRVESIDLYELTENELETLEKGPPNQDFNYAISLISTVFAFLVAWATSDFKSDKIEINSYSLQHRGLL